MDASLIRMEVDNLASNANYDFSYNMLVNRNEGKAFWATQVALSRCYKYEFNAELAQKANLVGNVQFYQFRARLEQQLQQFIRENFLAQTKQWDTTKPAHEYINFLEELICSHSSYNHRFFTEFLPEEATKECLRFYLAQESSPRFDDLLALIQVGNPIKMKMELAKNYWDEMGNGNFSNVHATMFAKVLQYFNVTTEYSLEHVILSSLVSDNLSSILALYRENYAHAIGYLAVTEFCVPRRFKYLLEACRRLNVPEDILAYHILHTDIDGEHAEGWFREIVVPLIEKAPHIADKITEGALFKLNSSQYFFDGILKNLPCYSSQLEETV